MNSRSPPSHLTPASLAEGIRHTKCKNTVRSAKTMTDPTITMHLLATDLICFAQNPRPVSLMACGIKKNPEIM